MTRSRLGAPPFWLAQGAAAVVVLTLTPFPAYAAGKVEPVFTFADPEIDESSGLVDLGRTVLTTNDSGDDPVIYAVDSRTGETVGRTTYTTDEVRDVEALAPGRDGELWVGDIGDNAARRVSVAVYRFTWPGRGDRTVQAQRYDFVYAGGPRDAEALLVHPVTGRLYVVSKGLFGGHIYRAPARLRSDQPNRLTRVGGAGGLVTDGGFLPDGRHFLLRDYGDAMLYDTETLRPQVGFRLPDQQQGEGLAVRADGRRFLISTEGTNSLVQSVGLPARARSVLDPPPEPTPAPSPAPAAGDRDEADGYSTGEVVALSAAVLGAALGIRLVVRAVRRRSRSRR